MKSRKDKSPDPNREDRKCNDDPNKADSKGEKRSLPGDYPSNEDIMNKMNTRRVGIDVENFSRAVGTENFNVNEPVITNPNSVEEDPMLPGEDLEDRRDHYAMEHPVTKDMDETDLDIPEGNESDVTEEDLQALGPKDLSMDMGEDEKLLKNRVWPVDMAGGDLDVPGAELDDANEAIGSEDEENNPYSLGGDSHEDNLEGK